MPRPFESDGISDIHAGRTPPDRKNVDSHEENFSRFVLLRIKTKTYFSFFFPFAFFLNDPVDTGYERQLKYIYELHFAESAPISRR